MQEGCTDEISKANWRARAVPTAAGGLTLRRHATAGWPRVRREPVPDKDW